MALVVHFNFELHQIDVMTTFLNGEINETIYMVKLKNFVPMTQRKWFIN